MSRPSAATRLLRGWDRGFAPGAELLLTTLSSGYRSLLGTREWLYERGVLHSRSLPCLVVSIGNLTVGGTGKTPAVELAVSTLGELGRRVAIVSRGYRRKTRGVQVVADTASIRLDPEDAGDEPFLLARRLPGVPVVVGANRHEAAKLAVTRFGVDAVVLDDGFQHRTLTKDLEIVMARAPNPWGNGRLLPRGPLREPLAALVRADLVIGTGAESPADVSGLEETVHAHAPAVPVLAARHVPVECWEVGHLRTAPLGELAGARLVAFSGIGSPGAFAQTLAGLRVVVAGFEAFPDHHAYSSHDVTALDEHALAQRADGFITTEKDWIRLRRLALPSRPLYVLSVRLEIVKGLDTWRQAFEHICRH